MAFTKITTNVVEDQAITADKIDISTLPPAGVVVTNNTEDGDITVTGDVEGSSLTITGSAGPMVWNSVEEALDIPLNSNVTLQAGQENVFRIKATEAISNGEVVMFAGAQGDHILGAKADQQAVGFSPEYVIGVATQDFSINEFGFVTTFGKVRGLDTSGYAEGNILYLNPSVAGALTTTKPTPPDHIHQIAAVLSSNPAEGTILVRPTHFSDTDEILEGTTNLYYTDTRANSAIDARVTTPFLSNLLDAGDVDYDNAVSGISANTVQEAIDYLNTLSGGSSGDVASYTRQKFVATEGQTTFTVTDGYTLGYLEVYFNGVLLDTTDYTANDESTVVLSVAASAGDEIATIAHDSFAISEILRTTSISASAPDDAIEVAATGTVTINANTADTLRLENAGATGYASMSMVNSSSNLAHVGLGGVSAGNADLRDTVFFGSISDLPVKFTQNDTIAASITTDGHFIISGKETLGVPTASVSSGLEVGSDVGGGFINISGGYTPDSALNIRDLEGSYVSFFIGPTKAGGIDVGSVDNLLIYNATAGHFGLELGSLGIAPTDNTGTSVDDTVDLGHSEKRFKVAHLSESVNTPELKMMNGTDNFLTITKDAGNSFGVVGSEDVGLGFISSNDTANNVRIIPRRIGTTVASDRLVDLGDAGSEFRDLYLGGNLIIDGTPLRPVYGFTYHKTSSPASTTAADNWYTYSAGQFTYTTTKTNSYIHAVYNLDSAVAFDNPTGVNHGYVEVRLRVEYGGSTFYSSSTRFWIRVDNFTGIYEMTRLLTGEWTSAITAPAGTVITVVPEYIISRTAGTGLSRGGISTWSGTSMISLWELKA